MAELNRIPDDSLVLVCDSRKALFLRNAGTSIHPQMEVLEHMDAPRPDPNDEPEHPGKRYDGGSSAAGFHPRSAMETTDVEKLRAKEFAEAIAESLTSRQRGDGFKHLIIAAPPEFLGLLRDEISDGLADLVMAEIPKRLTGSPVEKIATSLIAEW